ncbi:uncharacterized protein LOC116387310 [Anarrhichthys ocellatus]|uniref:uncharacterized protein LOC116387310 n=1 Tax=Anarrhichthys ocellatus TaxID=433405 RepID=UPI0012EDB937|nr:uncharacterized protein LOC116387310 [Anarrhichthys ocellatus]
MAAREQRSREEEFLIDQEPFRSNALLLIDKMLDLSNQVRQEALVDEILHSIFFFGKLRKPSVSPESILSHDEMFNDLERRFPEPFKLYSSQLPRRSPFSCVLDMIVLLLGRQKETDIIGRLRMLIKDLKPDESRDLVPSTICVSNKTDNKDQVKYYGVSMSAPTGPLPRRFMIAASCLSNWDRYVAGAVMTYFPIKKKNPHFDGTIKIPQHVRCQAFDLLDKKSKPPCRSCANMFGLTTAAENVSVYGNCAEVESLTNLFKNGVDVKEQARPTSSMYSDEKREKVENLVKGDLRNLLKEKKWNFTWNGHFYPPR